MGTESVEKNNIKSFKINLEVHFLFIYYKKCFNEKEHRFLFITVTCELETKI